MNDTSKKVLIVEDDIALADAFSMVLKISGFEVVNSYNGKQALEYLEEGRADIIVLDILMPVMDGREFLKRYNNHLHIPILALSNLDAKSEVEKLRELGVARYVLKASVSPQTLVSLVRSMLEKTTE